MNKTQRIRELIEEVQNLKLHNLSIKRNAIYRELKWIKIVSRIIDEYEEKLAKTKKQTLIDNTTGIPKGITR
jgi:hypothetical protein